MGKKRNKNKYNDNIMIHDTTTALWNHIRDIILLKYNEEKEREQSLIQQSSQMQTAFSFITAALFMALPAIIDNRCDISLEYILITFSVITLLLLISLFLASKVQWRWKRETLADSDVIKQFIFDTYLDLQQENERIAQYSETVMNAQLSIKNLNEKRTEYILASMVLFYISLLFIVLFYIGGIIILFL